jgi:hypothetical protein
MTPCELPVLLSLYAEIAPGELFRTLQRNLGVRTHDRIYSPRVVLWMMMGQRLDPRGTLAKQVEQLVQGKFTPLLSQCKRVREKDISLATGGYCQARQSLPLALMERSVEQIVQRLREHLSQAVGLDDGRVYVVDGSSLQVDAQPAVKRAYPPAENQHGKAHWPVVRIVVLHELETGLAERPCWGPMNGPGAVSEQALAHQAMEPLPPGSVILGDRNFGVFSIALGAQQRGHGVVLRLTEVRAKALLKGTTISCEGDYRVDWRPSRFDRLRPEIGSGQAGVAGRLIARRVGRGKSKQWLYLFTTLEIPADKVVEIYGRRWGIESDLRSLKQTVRLHRLMVQSVDLMQKELLAAVLAYNLVRAIMCLAARHAGLEARELSFTYAYNIVSDGMPGVLAAVTEAEQIRRLERIVYLVARCRLPKRNKPRSYPRAVWGRGFRYASHERGQN